MSSGKKRTDEEIKELVESFNYKYIYGYIHNQANRVVVEDKNGYRYDVTSIKILKSKNISFVHKENPFTLSHNIPLWLELNNSQFKLLENNEYKGSSLKLNFYCKKCKDYPKISWNKIYQKRGCPICSGDQVGIYHDLAVQFPEIASEWHPTKNGNLTPFDITYGVNKEVWWLCPNGHDYYSSVNNRTNMGSGCKKCSNNQQESKIATGLKRYILNKHHAEEEYPIFKNPETNRPLPFDIYIFGGKDQTINGIYIEVHWKQHYMIEQRHKQSAKKKGTSSEEEFENQKHRDRLKRRFARKNGTYIEVDLRKIKTLEEAIFFIDEKLKTLYF